MTLLILLGIILLLAVGIPYIVEEREYKEWRDENDNKKVKRRNK